MKLHTARKDHTCSLCGNPIKKGDRYWRDFIEDVRDNKQHTNCDEHETRITANISSKKGEWQ